MDRVTLMTLGVLLISLLIFYWFWRFTRKLMKQHNNIYDLLIEMEEEEKKKG